jgi:hypothetical protein
MKRKVFLTIVGLMMLGVCTPVCSALETLGPPAAGLMKGQCSIGVDYSYSEVDIDLYNSVWKDSDGDSYKYDTIHIKGYTLNIVTANLGYGITDNVEGFLRLGAGAPKDMKGDVYDGTGKIMGDTGFAIGFGTKATFWEKDNLKLGGIFQFGWSKPNGAAKINWGSDDEPDVWHYSADLRLTEIQLAVGPTYKLADWISIYGGPFLRYIDGHMKVKGHDPTDPTYSEKFVSDIREANYFGGFLGTQVELIKKVPFNFEWQHTATDDTIAMNLIWKF